jgi:hypothetical protein
MQNFFYFNGKTQGIQILNYNRSNLKWNFEKVKNKKKKLDKIF